MAAAYGKIPPLLPKHDNLTDWGWANLAAIHSFSMKSPQFDDDLNQFWVTYMQREQVHQMDPHFVKF